MVQIKSESMFKSNTLSIQRYGLIFNVICWPLKVNMKQHHKDSVLCISKWIITIKKSSGNWLDCENGVCMTADWRGWKY